MNVSSLQMNIQNETCQTETEVWGKNEIYQILKEKIFLKTSVECSTILLVESWSSL